MDFQDFLKSSEQEKRGSFLNSGRERSIIGHLLLSTNVNSFKIIPLGTRSRLRSSEQAKHAR